MICPSVVQESLIFRVFFACLVFQNMNCLCLVRSSEIYILEWSMSVSVTLSTSSSSSMLVIVSSSVADSPCGSTSASADSDVTPVASPSVHGDCGWRPPGRRTAFASKTDAPCHMWQISPKSVVCQSPVDGPTRCTGSMSIALMGVRNFPLQRVWTFSHTSSWSLSGTHEMHREFLRVYCSKCSCSFLRRLFLTEYPQRTFLCHKFNLLCKSLETSSMTG